MLEELLRSVRLCSNDGAVKLLLPKPMLFFSWFSVVLIAYAEDLEINVSPAIDFATKNCPSFTGDSGFS